MLHVLLCFLEVYFISDCPQFWDALADIKHPKHAGACSSVEVNKARPMSEVEARKKENLKVSHDEDTRRDKENRNPTQNRNAGL